MMFDINNKTSN